MLYKYYKQIHVYLYITCAVGEAVLFKCLLSHLVQIGDAGSIAEDPFNCDVISQEEGAVQQLILMALSDNEIVVEQACKTISMVPLSSCMPVVPCTCPGSFDYCFLLTLDLQGEVKSRYAYDHQACRQGLCICEVSPCRTTRDSL